MTVLELKNIKKRYGTDDNIVEVLKGIDLKFTNAGKTIKSSLNTFVDGVNSFKTGTNELKDSISKEVNEPINMLNSLRYRLKKLKEIENDYNYFLPKLDETKSEVTYVIETEEIK